MNNEQEKSRKRGDMDVRFDVIEPFVFRLYMARRPANRRTPR
jgi:hypothetical protein